VIPGKIIALLKPFRDKSGGPEKGRFIALSLLTVWRESIVHFFNFCPFWTEMHYVEIA
jgi:hypothetical protein